MCCTQKRFHTGVIHSASQCKPPSLNNKEKPGQLQPQWGVSRPGNLFIGVLHPMPTKGLLAVFLTANCFTVVVSSKEAS